MSGRGADSSFLTELESAKNQPVHLVEAYFDAGTTHITDAARALEYGGNTYTAAGALLGFEAVEESADLIVHECRVSLSGVGGEWVAAVLTTDFIDRRIVIRKALLGSDGAFIGSPVIIFDGRMDSPSIDMDPQSGTFTVTVSATSQLANLQRVTGRRTNDTDMQLYFSGDRGMQYAFEGVRQLIWGRPGP